MKNPGSDHGNAATPPVIEPGAWLAPLYFLLYLAYLFWRQEGELLHWVSMVLLPFLLVLALHRRAGGSLSSSFGSVGIRRGNLGGGLRITVALGVILGCVQLLLSRSGPAVLEAVLTGRALWLFPLAFVLMVLTAGFTEEFFFRGFLQTRLESLTHSRGWGLALASVAFGLYHLPYAYLNPHWPSAGDWGAALGASLGQGIPGGLILGGLFIFSRRNLLACVLLHALVDTFPAMGLIKFGG